MTRSLRLLTLVVLAASAAAVPAWARPTRVALTRIEGDTTGLGKAVAGALDDSELDVISGKRVARAIDRLKLADALGDDDLVKLAAELEVDAVVTATFDRRGHKLRFAIFSSGKTAKPFSLAAAKPESDKFRKLVKKTLEAKLASVVQVSREVVAEDKPAKAEAAAPPAKAPKIAARDDDAPAKAPRVAARDDDAPAKAPRIAARDDDAPAKAPTIAARDDGPPAGTDQAWLTPSPPGAVHRANLAALRVDLGASLSGRSLRFNSTAPAAAPRPYKNAPVPGARIEAELYPFALVDPSSWLAGFGVAADYDQVISLTLRASDEMTVPLKITERRYSFGARYRFAFGHRSTSPTLTLGAGYGARTFAVDRSGLMTPTSIDLPDVDYRMFDPGLAFRLPLGGRLVVTLGARGFLVTSAGAIQRPDQYGTAQILGGSASAGVELVIGDRIAVRLAAEATQLDLTFSGTGELARDRDGDPSTIDVRGATDRYYGGTATVAVTY